MPFRTARLLFVTLSVLMVVHVDRADAQEWTQFRGPTGQGTSLQTGLPTRWSTTDNLAWVLDLPGKAWSSPVVSKGRLYLTTAVPLGEETVASEGKFTKKVETAYSLRVLCLDATSGETLWDTEVSQVPPKISIHPKNSHASGTPIVTDERVLVHFGIHGTAALSLQGEILWQKKIVFKPVHGSGGSPILHDDLMIFHCDGGADAFVIALDQSSGEERWRTQRSVEEKRMFSFATPLVIADGKEETLVSPASHAAYGYDPHTGKEKWHVRYENKWSIVPRPVFADGLILICTGYEGPAELLAIRTGGTGDVTESHVQWTADRFVPHNPSPIVDHGLVFMVSDAGIASCRDLETGELKWKERLDGNYSASPFIADGLIYFLSEDGVCSVVKASATFEEIATNDMAERSLASMVPIENGILLRTESKLYRIGDLSKVPR